uniref:Uncharacterized protein n=1 Tax=Ixodes ricinus TaxID=34613 RepID=A0A6B0UI65_IXORI
MCACACISFFNVFFLQQINLTFGNCPVSAHDLATSGMPSISVSVFYNTVLLYLSREVYLFFYFILAVHVLHLYSRIGFRVYLPSTDYLFPGVQFLYSI